MDDAISRTVVLLERGIAREAGKTILGSLLVLGLYTNVIDASEGRVGEDDGLGPAGIGALEGRRDDGRFEIGQPRIGGDVEVHVSFDIARPGQVGRKEGDEGYIGAVGQTGRAGHAGGVGENVEVPLTEN